MGCDGIFDRMTNLEVQELAWKTIEECKPRFLPDSQNYHASLGLSIHQVCGKVVDALMQNAARERSFDNLTIVMVAFKGLIDYLLKKDITTGMAADQLNPNQRNIKIQEEGSNSNHNTSFNTSDMQKRQMI